MARHAAAILLALLALVVGPTTAAYGSASGEPRSVTYLDLLLKWGQDGVIRPGELGSARQMVDKIAIAQWMTETKDGGRLTRAEAVKIMAGYTARNQKTDAELLVGICKQHPLYPPCKNR